MKKVSTLMGAVAVAAMASACGGGSSNAGKPVSGGGHEAAKGGGGTYEVPAMAGEVKCYKGIAAIEMANGTEMSDVPVYWRRAWDAGAGVLTEDAVTVVNGAASRSWSELTASDNGLVVKGKYKGGVFSGSATAQGEAGAWTSWVVDTELDAGAKVHSEHAVEGEAIATKSVVSDGAGTPMMQVVQRMEPMDASECASLFSQWEPL